MKSPDELMTLSDDELEKYLLKRTKKELIMYVMAFVDNEGEDDTEEDTEEEDEEED